MLRRVLARPLAAALIGPAFVAVLIVSACGSAGDPAAPTSASPSRPARLLIVAGDGQSAPVGTELASAITAKVIDAAGTPVAGQIVNFRVTAGGGSVYAGAAITNAQGVAAERWTLGTSAADSQRVEARAVDPETGARLVFATFSATATAGPAASLVRQSPDTQTAIAGTRVAVAPAVRVADQYGNPVAGAHVSFRVASGGGAVSDTAATSDAGGIAALATWTLGAAAGANTVSATVAGLPPVLIRAAGAAPPAQPTLVLSATSLAFVGVAGGAPPADQSLTLESTSGALTGVTATVTYGTSQPTDWLLGNVPAATPGVLTLRAVPTALAPGVYTAVVNVLAPGASNTPQAVAILFVVVAPSGSGAAGNSLCQAIAGASVVANDGTFLGTLTSKFDARSVLNEFGVFGSKYSATSIWNPYGQYGSAYGALSAFNAYASKPPVLVKAGEALAFLTVNGALAPRVDPRVLGSCAFP